VLTRHMGDVFPEIRVRQSVVEAVLKREEEAFNRTLDRGIELFNQEAARLELFKNEAETRNAAPENIDIVYLSTLGNEEIKKAIDEMAASADGAARSDSLDVVYLSTLSGQEIKKALE